MWGMVILRFPDEANKSRALGYLTGRFSVQPWGTGELSVPEEALSALARERISFSVEYEPEYVSREEAIAAFERGETLEPVEAFAKIAGVTPEEMQKRLDDHVARYYGGKVE